MSQKLPLSGIRVLELSAYISGPYATSLMCALGAEVVKVEPPKGGDAFRRSMEDKSVYFVQYNAGKRSIAIDLKRKEGVELVKALLPKFDVVVDNNRPGKMAALGLGADACRAINPAIVYSTVSGFGEEGEWRDRAAYDSVGQSMAGFYSVMSNPGQPQLSGTCIGDLVTALVSCTGILAALVGRFRNSPDQGNTVQTSLLEAISTITIDAMSQMFEDGIVPNRLSRHPQAQNFCLNTASGGGITLHLSSPEKFWRALCTAMDREDLPEDPRFLNFPLRQTNYNELKAIVEDEFLKRSRDEWEKRLIDNDVPFGPVLTLNEVVEHPQTKLLKLIEPERHGQTLVRPPWRFAGERPTREVPAPKIGQHTRAIAREVIGDAEIEKLIAAGVISETNMAKARA